MTLRERLDKAWELDSVPAGREAMDVAARIALEMALEKLHDAKDYKRISALLASLGEP